MRSLDRLVAIAALSSLAACATSGDGGDRAGPIVYQLNSDLAGTTAADGGTPEFREPAYAAELTEEQRRAWFLARRPDSAAERYVPRADNGPHPPPEPVRVIHHHHGYDAAWAVPITLGIGYGLYRLKRHGDRRHHHHHHGRWGVSWDWWYGYRW